MYKADYTSDGFSNCRLIQNWNAVCFYDDYYIFHLSSDKLAKRCKLKSTGFNPDFMIDETIPFPLDFPLYELPNLPDEVLFAFHVELRKFIYLNVAFEKVWQIPRASIMSDLSILINTVHEDDRTHVRDAFTAMQKDKQKQTVEFRIQSPGEEQKWIKLNGYVLKKGNTEVVVGIATDFSAERNYSETLHKFNNKKNSILQILSHDLLGPLGNIEVSTHLLSENSMVNADESVMKIVNLISKSSQRSITMIRDLITAEFLQTAESAFVKQRVDLG